jgi:hypothetical protein
VQRRLTAGFTALRVLGCGALILLIWNPVFSRVTHSAAPPLVLLDASLSMGAHWRQALDSARALAHGGAIWRFGGDVAAFDTLPPADGTSRLAPALDAAAARGGPIVIVTDGAVNDVPSIAPDLLKRPRVVVLPGSQSWDAYVAGVDGPHRVMVTDTLRLAVTYGTAGARVPGSAPRMAMLVAELQGRRLASHKITLPDSGVVSSDLVLPASLLASGWSALHVMIVTPGDDEPRDDARAFVVEVSAAPSVVVLAAPPDWDLRFFARALADVARVPLQMFVSTEPRGEAHRWRDATTLVPVSQGEVSRALAAARLVVLGGDPASLRRVAPVTAPAMLRWPTVGGEPGDWYVDPPLASALAAGLVGVAWDSLPPAAAVLAAATDSTSVVILTARLARRGSARPIVVISERGAARRAEITAAGLYRWAFRGGASAEAYRAVVAALADWLLGEGGRGKGERAAPLDFTVANGLPIEWRWTGEGAPRDVGVTLRSAEGERRDTLRFDAAGRSRLRLAPGVYDYALEGGPERGMVVVETWSAEWQPTRPALAAQAGTGSEQTQTVAMRDRWWLYALAIGAFAAEWAWRRRQGLP